MPDLAKVREQLSQVGFPSNDQDSRCHARSLS
jgi:hypothetical protein